MESDIDNFRRIFRQNLKHYREENGITQIELSRLSNFDSSYIGKIERGDVDPSLESINRICEALDLTPEDLLLPSSGEDDRYVDSEFSVQQIELDMQTEQLRNRERELTEIKNRYKRLYHESPVGFFTLDDDGVLQECNRTFRTKLGWEDENPEGRHVNEFLQEDARDDFYRYRRELKKGEDIEPGVFVFLTRDGGTLSGAVEKVTITKESTEDTTRFALTDVSRWVGEERDREGP